MKLRMQPSPPSPRTPAPLLLYLLACSPILLLVFLGTSHGELSVTTGQIAPLKVTAHTGMKPQSKLWKHNDSWWGCFSDSTGTHIWQMGETSWTRHTTISPETGVRADVLPEGPLVTILLFHTEQSTLLRYLHMQESGRYSAEIEPSISVTLDEGVETATIARDGDGLLWLASDGEQEVNVRWLSDAGKEFSEPIRLSEGITKDDICAITTLADGSVGVLWSNQNTQRYGFRRHVPASEPHSWFPDETPADRSAIDHGDGMSDDHLNFAISSDGTLFATVKTSYDTEGMPLVATLIRHPHGRWDPLYHVDDEGSRGIMLLDESKNEFLVVYTSYRDSSIVLKHSHTDEVAFSNRVALLEHPRINNISATRQTVSGSFPIVASQGDTLMHTVILELR